MWSKKRRPHAGPPFEKANVARQLHAGAAKHGNRAAVLRPAGNIVADGDRTFLAVGDRLQALRRDAARSEIVLGSSGTAGAEREVVFARAAFVGMAFDGDLVIRVTAEPLGLTVERLRGIGADRRGVGVKEDAVADIDREVWAEPGVAAPPAPAPRPRSPALFGGFLAQLASARPARSAIMTGLRAKFCMRLIAGV